jgi:hypothetical protein
MLTKKQQWRRVVKRFNHSAGGANSPARYNNNTLNTIILNLSELVSIYTKPFQSDTDDADRSEHSYTCTPSESETASIVESSEETPDRSKKIVRFSENDEVYVIPNLLDFCYRHELYYDGYEIEKIRLSFVNEVKTYACITRLSLIDARKAVCEQFNQIIVVDDTLDAEVMGLSSSLVDTAWASRRRNNNKISDDTNINRCARKEMLAIELKPKNRINI